MLEYFKRQNHEMSECGIYLRIGKLEKFSENLKFSSVFFLFNIIFIVNHAIESVLSIALDLSIKCLNERVCGNYAMDRNMKVLLSSSFYSIIQNPTSYSLIPNHTNIYCCLTTAHMTSNSQKFLAIIS